MEPVPRKSRQAWNEPGQAHFLTFSCVHRWPLLNRERTCRWVIAALESARRSLELALWAYVIMPEHVHVLLCPRRPNYQMRRILVALKQPVAKAARQHLEVTGQRAWLERLTVRYPSRHVFRFWQPGGGYDENVFRDKTWAAVMEYIHANPVRRELAAQATDWEWSSARFWEGRADVPIQMDHPYD